MTVKKIVSDIFPMLIGKSVPYIKKKICGEYLGCGTHRGVFVLKQNHRYVVKIERYPGDANFANVTEWRNYINNREWSFFAERVAACEAISTDGVILIQRRVRFRPVECYPREVASIFTDIKMENFGWIGSRFVCCDYAYLPFRLPGKKTRRVKWDPQYKHKNYNPVHPHYQ